MAQTGFTPIQLYRTTTATTAPSAGNLAAGELAINTTDEKLYFKNTAGVVKLLASNAGSEGTVTSVNGTGTVNGITLTGTVTSSGNLTLGGTLANVSLTTQITGTLPIANGGTNSTAAPTAGGVGYGTGTAHAYTIVGIAGQILVSTGSGAPEWQNPNSVAGAFIAFGSTGGL